MAPRKTASSKAAGKRRQVQSDNSECEQLIFRSAKTGCGPENKLFLDPTFIAELDAVLQVTASDQNTSAAPLSVRHLYSPPNGDFKVHLTLCSRSRTKTEKVKLLAEATATEKAIEKTTTPADIGGIDSDDEFPEHVLPVHPKHVATSTPKPTAVLADHLQLAESLWDDVAVESDGTERPGGQVEIIVDIPPLRMVTPGLSVQSTPNYLYLTVSTTFDQVYWNVVLRV
ncbi:hypothetical protein BD779DRAFT_1482274 [Infundibulicybe gibba]|nr:hypothetical protein BD779DRAFT_1482274 [Infundibulicybe gibba]